MHRNIDAFFETLRHFSEKQRLDFANSNLIPSN